MALPLTASTIIFSNCFDLFVIKRTISLLILHYMFSLCFLGIGGVIEALRNIMVPPLRYMDKPLVLAVDHCFSIKGKGTILTGTLVQGRLSVNDVSIVL